MLRFDAAYAHCFQKKFHAFYALLAERMLRLWRRLVRLSMARQSLAGKVTTPQPRIFIAKDAALFVKTSR